MADTQDPGTATTDAADTTGAATTTQGENGATSTAAPADVDYTFEAPEGVTLNEARLTEAKAMFKELNLPKDAAAKLVALEVKRVQEEAAAFTKQVSDWEAEVRADKELGSDENIAAAKKLVATFGDDDLTALFNSTGMGSHPVVVRFISKMAKAIGEDKIIPNNAGPAGGVKDHAAVLYGTH